MTSPGLGRTILTYLIAGPPVGGLIFMASVAVFESMHGNSGAWPPDIVEFMRVLHFIVGFSYLFGALPAILASLMMATLIKRGMGHVKLLVFSVPVGFAAGCLALFWVILGPNGNMSKLGIIVSIGSAGAAAALVSTLALSLIARRKDGGGHPAS